MGARPTIRAVFNVESRFVTNVALPMAGSTAYSCLGEASLLMM
jgi:hypothetical protein